MYTVFYRALYHESSTAYTGMCTVLCIVYIVYYVHCIYTYMWWDMRKGTTSREYLFFITQQNSRICPKTGHLFSLAYTVSDESPFPTFPVNLSHGDHRLSPE